MSWFSKQWNKSKRKGTGIFSWGDSDLAKLIPGVGGSIDSALDQLGSTAGGGNGTANMPAPQVLSSPEVQQRQFMTYAVGAFIIYLLVK